MNLAENFHDAMRYWEPRRLVYNGVLAVWTLLLTGRELIELLSGNQTAWQLFGLFIVMAGFTVVANLLYCTAYVADLAVQASKYQEIWRERRGILFGIGTALACLCVVLVFYLPDNM